MFINNRKTKLTLYSLILTFCLAHGWILRLPCKTESKFDVIEKDRALENSIIGESNVTRVEQCFEKCENDEKCKSINHKENGEKNCQLNSKIQESAPAIDFKVSTNWTYYATNYNTKNIGTFCEDYTPCAAHTYCIDTCQCPGYRCVECSPGYTLNSAFQCVDIDECASNPCQNGGHCNNHIGKYSCTCQAGFTGENCVTAQNCEDYYLAGQRVNGVYKLDIGDHYCMLNNFQCGQAVPGGWTLAMKSKGDTNIFETNSPHWSTDTVYNVHLTSLDEENAKFQAFNKLPVSKVCLVMKPLGTQEYRSIVVWLTRSSSLLDIFLSGNTIHTLRGRDKWLDLIKDAILQNNCNREGFNLKKDNNPAIMVRFGIMGNGEDDCASPDSFLGVGISSYLSGHAGNIRNPSIKAMAYFFVQ